jgi:hypothetical protein
VTTLDLARSELGHVWPSFLPDGRHFLYVTRSEQSEYDGMLCVGSLDSATRVTLFHVDSQALYARNGYLHFMQGNRLVAQRFDPDTFKVTSAPEVVADLTYTWRSR